VAWHDQCAKSLLITGTRSQCHKSFAAICTIFAQIEGKPR
jgi:hypothetical protein